VESPKVSNSTIMSSNDREGDEIPMIVRTINEIKEDTNKHLNEFKENTNKQLNK
jgi:hypothetical protein